MDRPPSCPNRLLAASVAVAGLSIAAGCTMCPDSLDYSGPVPNGSAPQNDFRARSNGILPLGAAPRPWPSIVSAEGGPGPRDGIPTLAADIEPLPPPADDGSQATRSVLVSESSARQADGGAAGAAADESRRR